MGIFAFNGAFTLLKVEIFRMIVSFNGTLCNTGGINVKNDLINVFLSRISLVPPRQFWNKQAVVCYPIRSLSKGNWIGVLLKIMNNGWAWQLDLIGN